MVDLLKRAGRLQDILGVVRWIVDDCLAKPGALERPSATSATALSLSIRKA